MEPAEGGGGGDDDDARLEALVAQLSAQMADGAWLERNLPAPGTPALDECSSVDAAALLTALAEAAAADAAVLDGAMSAPAVRLRVLAPATAALWSSADVTARLPSAAAVLNPFEEASPEEGALLAAATGAGAAAEIRLAGGGVVSWSRADAGAPPPAEDGDGEGGGEPVLGYERVAETLGDAPAGEASLEVAVREVYGLESASRLTGLGGSVWASALVLSRWVHRAAGLLPGWDRSVVIELGAGLGLPGLVAGALGAGEVVLTDYAPEVLAQLEYGLTLNERTLGGRCRARRLDYFVPETLDLVLAELPPGTFGSAVKEDKPTGAVGGRALVVASEAVFTAALGDAFAATVARLLLGEGVAPPAAAAAFLVQDKRRTGYAETLAALQERGLECVEEDVPQSLVRGHDAPGDIRGVCCVTVRPASSGFPTFACIAE